MCLRSFTRMTSFLARFGKNVLTGYVNTSCFKMDFSSRIIFYSFLITLYTLLSSRKCIKEDLMDILGETRLCHFSKSTFIEVIYLKILFLTSCGIRLVTWLSLILKILVFILLYRFLVLLRKM